MIRSSDLSPSFVFPCIPPRTHDTIHKTTHYTIGIFKGVSTSSRNSCLADHLASLTNATEPVNTTGPGEQPSPPAQEPTGISPTSHQPTRASEQPESISPARSTKLGSSHNIPTAKKHIRQAADLSRSIMKLRSTSAPAVTNPLWMSSSVQYPARTWQPTDGHGNPKDQDIPLFDPRGLLPTLKPWFYSTENREMMAFPVYVDLSGKIFGHVMLSQVSYHSRVKYWPHNFSVQSKIALNYKSKGAGYLFVDGRVRAMENLKLLGADFEGPVTKTWNLVNGTAILVAHIQDRAPPELKITDRYLDGAKTLVTESNSVQRLLIRGNSRGNVAILPSRGKDIQNMAMAPIQVTGLPPNSCPVMRANSTGNVAIPPLRGNGTRDMALKPIARASAATGQTVPITSLSTPNDALPSHLVRTMTALSASRRGALLPQLKGIKVESMAMAQVNINNSLTPRSSFTTMPRHGLSSFPSPPDSLTHGDKISKTQGIV